MSRRTEQDVEREDVLRRFVFHAATAATAPKHKEVRVKLRELAAWVLEDVPPSRERALALTALQEAMMWANAAIAIHTEAEPLRDGVRDEA